MSSTISNLQVSSPTASLNEGDPAVGLRNLDPNLDVTYVTLGSYQKLEDDNTITVWKLMTGCIDDGHHEVGHGTDESKRDEIWKELMDWNDKQYLVYMKATKPELGSPGVVGTNPEMTQEQLEVMKTHQRLSDDIEREPPPPRRLSMAEVLSGDYQETCELTSKHGSAGGAEPKAEEGLVQRQAYYTILQVKEPIVGKGKKGRKTRMVCMRDPGDWQWSGDWGSKSTKWKEHPEVAKQLGFNGQDDTLWMEWEDLIKEGVTLGCICKCMNLEVAAQLRATAVAATKHDEDKLAALVAASPSTVIVDSTAENICGAFSKTTETLFGAAVYHAEERNKYLFLKRNSDDFGTGIWVISDKVDPEGSFYRKSKPTKSKVPHEADWSEAKEVSVKSQAQVNKAEADKGVENAIAAAAGNNEAAAARQASVDAVVVNSFGKLCGVYLKTSYSEGKRPIYKLEGKEKYIWFESLNGGIWKIGDKVERGGAYSTKSEPTEATKVSPHEADWTQAAGRTSVSTWDRDSTAAALRKFQAQEDKKKMDTLSGDERLAFKQQRDDEEDERNTVGFTYTLQSHPPARAYGYVLDSKMTAPTLVDNVGTTVTPHTHAPPGRRPPPPLFFQEASLQEKQRLLDLKAEQEQRDQVRLARASSSAPTTPSGPRVSRKKTSQGVNTSEAISQGIQPSVSLDDMF